MARPRHSGLAWADALVSALTEKGVDTYFIGPGSRSTPLVLAIAKNPRATTVVHPDERAVAFAALGFARATQRPAAVVTTSGTAVANLFPAVVEASMDAQPMIVLSADRPAEARGTGANQTIDQVQMFGSYVRYFVDLPAPDERTRMGAAREVVEQALAAARLPTPGPVHLNCMFREPLAPEYDADLLDDTAADAGVPQWYDVGTDLQAADEGFMLPDGLRERLQSAQRGIVVAGRLHGLADARAAERIADDLDWPLLADIGSQVSRVGDARVVASYDRILFDPDAALSRPDFVLQLGGSFVSKRLGLWLAEQKPADVVHVTGDTLPYDPYGVVTERVQCTPSQLAALLQPEDAATSTAADASWLAAWRDASRRAMAVLDDEFEGNDEAAIDEPTVAHLVWHHARRGSALLLGNSMPVRDFDMFAWGAKGPQFVATNRGASGIDGLLATAFGVALGRRCPVVAVVGDLSLLHDVGSLTMLAQSDQPIIVVVVNNGGGGIFSFLPIASHVDVFERYFAAAHALTFAGAASFAGLDYANPTTRIQFRGALDAAFSSGRSTMIEVKTSRADNKALHDRISARIS